ncbi:unnamed protein product [Rhodiola kirilowii]
MSNPSALSDAVKLVDRGAVRTADKLSFFAQTCSLLRDYVKEKGPLRGDLSFGLTFERKGVLEPIRQASAAQPAEHVMSMNLFPQQVDQSASCEKDHGDYIIKESATKEPEKRASQMTIFYAGQVLVLNLPSSKAEEVMRLASKASSKVLASAHTESNAAVPPLDSTAIPSTHTTNNDVSPFQVTQLSHQPIVAELPIKRKASLSRFLEKRKNRIEARAPYIIKSEETSKPADNKHWLELAAPSEINF